MRIREQLNESIGKANRCKVTNGSSLFLGNEVDGRSTHARRWRDVHEMLMADMGRDLTHTEKLLLRGIATMMVSAEMLESQMLSGDDAYDPAAYAKLVGTINRSFDRLSSRGLPVPGSNKDREPQTLEEHIQMRLKEKAENARR